MQPTYPANPAQYIAALPPDRRAAIEALHAAITKAGPKRTAKIWPISAQGMIGYGSYHYVYASKREGDWPIIALASQKNYLSLYLMVSDGRGYLAEQNKHRLGKVSVGKSCIRFKKLEHLDLTVAIELVKKTGKGRPALD